MIKKPRLGVAVLVRDSQGRLLLGRRGKQPNYGKWIIPGGGVLFGESLVKTAMREIKEETGLSIKVLARPPTISEIIRDDEHRVILFFEAVLTGGVVTPKASSDLLDARFFFKEGLACLDLSSVVVPILQTLGWLN